MAAYDSDSSEDVGDFTETNVLLGYASKEPVGDLTNHLGGYPAWLDEKATPPASLAKCKICNNFMSLLLELNGDLPEYFPHDERRLYIFTCRRKPCSRKPGSIRALRGTRRQKTGRTKAPSQNKHSTDTATVEQSSGQSVNLGSALFGNTDGTTSPSRGTSNTNPFSTSKSPLSQQPAPNPFATLPPPSTLAAKPPQRPAGTEEPSSLSATFAEKVRISSEPPPPPKTNEPIEPWPPNSSFPDPYPTHYLDADLETLSADPSIPQAASSSNSSSKYDADDSAIEKDSFESSLDKQFLRFSDRLAQNPEQVLRYEFKGQPLLYSATDVVGNLFKPLNPHAKVQVQGSRAAAGGRIPRCEKCGGARVFELQLVPHAITVLEEDEMDLEGGMEWGSVVLGVCERDCVENDGEVAWREEWVGVQWEEVLARK